MTDGQTKTLAAVSAAEDEKMIHEVERVIIGGDLRGLQPGQRLWYYGYRARHAGLDPLSQPFNWLSNRRTGGVSLYLNKEGAAQLRKKNNVSIEIVSAQEAGDYFEVRARAAIDGRFDEDFGGASLRGLTGDDRMNAKALAYTRAKRRVTISIVGLGILDESEVSGVPDLHRIQVDPKTGEILEAKAAGNDEDGGGKKDTPAAAPERPASDAQRKVMWNLWRKQHGLSKEQLSRFFWLTYTLRSTADLAEDDMKKLIEYLQTVSTQDLVDSLMRLEADDAQESKNAADLEVPE